MPHDDDEPALKELKDDIAKLHTQLAELRERLIRLEAERAERAAESVEN